MEYRDCHKGTHFENVVEVIVPDLYNNVTPGYADKLNQKKEALKALIAANKKKGTKVLLSLLAIAFLAFAFLAFIIELICGAGFTYWLLTVIISLVAAMAVAVPLSQMEKKKRKDKEEETIRAYEKDKVSFKANEYLYGVLKYMRILNLIMSNGTLTVFYLSTNDKPKCDVFKYEEWIGDENLKTPFLVFEDSRLYGRSNTQAESTTFTTSIIDN